MEEELLDEPEEEGFDDSGDDGGIAVPAPPPPPPPPPSTPKRTKRVRISSEAPEEVEEQPPAKDKPKPRGKGRPPGSANKPKVAKQVLTLQEVMQSVPDPEENENLFADWLSARMYTHETHATDAVAFMTNLQPVTILKQFLVNDEKSVCPCAADMYAFMYLNEVRVVPCAGTQASEVFRSFIRPPVEGSEVSYITYAPTSEMVTGLCADPVMWYNIENERAGEFVLHVEVTNPAAMIPGRTYGWWHTKQFEHWAEMTFGKELFKESEYMHGLFSDDFKGMIAALLDGVLGTTRGSHWKKVCAYLVYIRFTPIQIPLKEMYNIQLRNNIEALRKYDPMPETMISVIRRHPDYLKTCATWAVVAEYMALVRKHVQNGEQVLYSTKQKNRIIILDKLIEQYEEARDTAQELGDSEVYFDAKEALPIADKVKILQTVRKQLQRNYEAVLAKDKLREEKRLEAEAKKTAEELAALAVPPAPPALTAAQIAALAQAQQFMAARQAMVGKAPATPDKPRSRWGPKTEQPEDAPLRMQVDSDPYYQDPL